MIARPIVKASVVGVAFALAACGVQPSGPPMSGNNPGPGAPVHERLLSDQVAGRPGMSDGLPVRP